MRVPCTVDYRELQGRNSSLDGVVVTCSRCEKSTESFGTGEASIKRCLALLREDCDEENYYYAEEE